MVDVQLTALGIRQYWDAIPASKKIGANSATCDLLICDSFVIEPEMARLVERRVDDRIFVDDLTHALSCRAERADVEAIRPDLFTG